MSTQDQHAAGTFRKVLPLELPLFRDHLLRLDADSRRSRFGYAVPDSYIESYALRFRGFDGLLFGYFAGGHIRAAGEFVRSGTWGTSAEAAFSVEAEYSNHGIASELMSRIVRSARNRGIRRLELNCLAGNAAMRAIAGKFAADLQFEHGDVVAGILPRRADYFSLAAEAFEDRLVMYFAALDRQSRLAQPLAA